MTGADPKSSGPAPQHRLRSGLLAQALCGIALLFSLAFALAFASIGNEVLERDSRGSGVVMLRLVKSIRALDATPTCSVGRRPGLRA